MRCSKCGNAVEALFYPKHSSARRPKKNEFKCCQNCKIAHFQIATSPGVDCAKMMEEFRGEKKDN